MLSAAVAPSTPIHHCLDASTISHSPFRYSRNVRLLSTLAILLTHVLVMSWMISLASLLRYIRADMRIRTDANQLGSSVVQLLEPTWIVLVTVTACHGLAVLVILCRHLSCTSRRLITIFNTGRGRAANCLRFLVSHTPEVTFLRLLIEVSFQIFQAQKMSSRVATLWLNRLLACLIVLNCWFTPLVYFSMRGSSLRSKRVARLAGDTLLDVVYGVGFPSVIMHPYVRDFIPDISAFPPPFYVMDTWTTVAIAELGQMFVTSWLDLISKTAPGILLAYRLPSLHLLIHEQRKTSERGDIDSLRRMSWIARVLQLALLACGVLVLALHAHASWLAESADALGCLVEMRP